MGFWVVLQGVYEVLFLYFKDLSKAMILLYKTRFLLIVTTLTLSILTKSQFAYAKANYEGTASDFQISIGKSGDPTCGNTFTISQIKIILTARNSVTVSFNIKYTAPGGFRTESYSEVGSIANGTATFPQSSNYYWCDPNIQSRRTFWQPSITGISFTSSIDMNVRLTVSMSGYLTGSGSTSSSLHFDGKPGYYYSDPKPAGNSVCSSDAVGLFFFGDSHVDLSLYISSNGTSRWVRDIPSANDFSASTPTISIKISDYFPNLSDRSVIQFEVQAVTREVMSPSLTVFSPLPSGISLTTDKGDNPLLCESSSVTLSVKNAPANSVISWPDGGPLITNPQTKTYNADISKTNGSGTNVCPSVRVSTNIQINAFTATINTPPQTTKCQGETIELVSSPGGNGYSYTWKKDGQDFGSQNSVKATSSGSYTVTIQPSGVNCSPKTSAPVVLSFSSPVNAKDILSSNPKNIICGANIELTAQPEEAGISYSWQLVNGQFSSSNSKVTVSQAGRYVVTLTRGACYQQKSIDISDNNYNPDIASPPAAFCSDSPVTLTANSNDPGRFDYAWKRGTASVGGNTPALVLSGELGVFKYSVEITSKGSGCTAKKSTEISIKTDQAITGGKINAPAGKSRPIICGGTETFIELTATTDSPSEGVTYNWQGSGSGNTNTVKASQAGNYKVIFTRGACIKDASIQVESGAFVPTISIPSATIINSPTDVQICQGEGINIQSAISGTSIANSPDNFTYTWLGGSNGTTPLTGKNDNKLLVAASGQYSLQMTLTGSGCKAIDATPQRIKVVADPKIANPRLTPNPAIICNKVNGLTLTALADSSAGIAFSWSGGGTAGSDPAKYIVINAGTYTATFKRGACTVTASVSPKEEILVVNVTPPNSSNPILLCSGENNIPMTLKAVSNLSTATIKWMKDGAEAPGNNSAASYVPTQTGQYYAMANFDNICTATSPVRINTKALPNFSVNITPNNTSAVCDDRAIPLTATVSEAEYATQYQYQWVQDSTVVKLGIGTAGNILLTGKRVTYQGNTLVLGNESGYTVSVVKIGRAHV